MALAGDTCPPGPEPLGGAAVGRALMALEQLGGVADDLAPATRGPGTTAGFMGMEAGPREVSGELGDSAEGSRRRPIPLWLRLPRLRADLASAGLGSAGVPEHRLPKGLLPWAAPANLRAPRLGTWPVARWLWALCRMHHTPSPGLDCFASTWRFRLPFGPRAPRVDRACSNMSPLS